MEDRTGRLEYTRATLEEAPATRTSDYGDVDLESVHRALEARLENSREIGAPEANEVTGPSPLDGLRSELTSEETDDERSGAAEGRVSTVVDTGALESRSFSYKPRGPYGAMAIIIGLLAALPTVFISLLLSLFGYYLYQSESEGEIPLRRWDAIDVLVTGSGNDENDETSGDESSVRAIAAAEPFVGVDTDRLAELPWIQRKTIVMRIEAWAKQAFQRAPAKRNDEDVFFDYLTMWLKRNAETDVETVESLQAQLARDPAARRAYTERLREEGTSVPLEERETELDDVLAVLEDVQ